MNSVEGQLSHAVMDALGPLQLVSHTLCPYVQRAVIVLTEKGVPYTRTYVDLAKPPAWFQSISPLGKVPLLRVGDEVLFESAVICEFLDDVYAPKLHPTHPLQRAKHRTWMEFGSATLDNIWYFYTASDAKALSEQAQKLHEKFSSVEKQLGAGPYFAGDQFSIVDAVYGPIFRYFDVFDRIADFGVFTGLPKTQCWRQTLAQRASVQNAVATDYPEQLVKFFLKNQNSEISRTLTTDTQHNAAQLR